VKLRHPGRKSTRPSPRPRLLEPEVHLLAQLGRRPRRLLGHITDVQPGSTRVLKPPPVRLLTYVLRHLAERRLDRSLTRPQPNPDNAGQAFAVSQSARVPPGSSLQPSHSATRASDRTSRAVSAGLQACHGVKPAASVRQGCIDRAVAALWFMASGLWTG